MPHEEIPRHRLGTAKRLRREMTDAERKLWRCLRAHRFHDFGFRRQAPMGRYIVDFVCHRAKLVIEVDGGQHGLASHIARDRVRDQWLRSRGYQVLRFWNAEVLKTPEIVFERIAAALPPSQPSPARGEGMRRDSGGARRLLTRRPSS